MTLDAERRRLFQEGAPILDFVAKRIARGLAGTVELDDLMSVGRMALHAATESYDAARSKFTTYARYKIKWAILDHVRRETHTRRGDARVRALIAAEKLTDSQASEPEPQEGTQEDYQRRLTALLEGQAAALAIGIAASGDLGHLPADDDSPEDQVAIAELARRMWRAVEKLPERERALIERHYRGDEPFDVVAKDLGISKSWASRLHASALSSLARAMRQD